MRQIRWIAAVLLMVVGVALAAGEAGSPTVEDAAREHKVPKGWLKGSGPGGYERALALQEESGLDILVLFFRTTPSSEKGLLRWFEKKGLTNARVIKEMRRYIKVRIDANARDRRTRELVEAFHVGKTPRLVVRQPNGWTRRITVFDWPDGKPELATHEAIAERLRAGSSPRYQTDE